jgi:F0F1-type ATP synthase epsilon subunit
VGAIVLRVVTPKGVVLEERGLDEVVLRRREEAHASGSEIAVLRRHGPTLLQTGSGIVRYRRGEHRGQVRVEPGVAEVLGEVVTVLSPMAEVI